MQKSNINEDNVDAIIECAKNTALTAINTHVERLTQRIAEKNIRVEIFKHLPRMGKKFPEKDIKILIDTESIINLEKSRLNDFIMNRDLQSIIEKYPIRETPALSLIADKLGFKNREEYELAIRKLLMENVEAIQFVKSLFGTLINEVENS